MKKIACAWLVMMTSCGTHRPPASGEGAGGAAVPVLTRAPTAARLAYPETRRDDVTETLHGRVVRDPYRWLEDGASKEVEAWTEAEDALTRRFLSALPQRPRFVTALTAVMASGDVQSPMKRGDRYFYWKRDAHEDKRVLVVRDGLHGKERAVLDPNGRDAEGGSVSISEAWASPSGKYVAYRRSENNADSASVRIRDVSTGRDLADRIDGVRHNDVAWVPADAGFYYRASPTTPGLSNTDKIIAAQVKYHALGTDPANDAIVRDRAGDVNLDESPAVSADGRWLCITADRGYTRTDVLFRDRTRADATFTTLVEGRDAIFDVAVGAARFYVRTNDGAPRYQVFAVDPLHPERARWQLVVPERSDATLTAVRLAGKRLVVQWLENAVSKLELRNLDGSAPRSVPLDGMGTVDQLVASEEHGEVFARFSSFTTPSTILSIDSRSGDERVFASLARLEDEGAFVTEQTFFASRDGTRVPMFVVRRKTAARDGKNPVLLYGYGGFEQSLLPRYAPSVLAWLRAGGIYAAPNLRGGGEFGAAWHEAGMLAKKQNVFDDYIAAAEHLVREGWTNPARIAAKGQSNGGLLVAAAITQRPDLFRVALPRVPLTDMVRYTTTAAGRTWVPEYGSPEVPAELATLLAYSPYHHVTRGRAYPSVLLLGADSDDRLDAMHGRKLVAALQDATSGGPVLLSIQRKAGHMGADAVKRWIEDDADAYAFAFAEMGLP